MPTRHWLQLSLTRGLGPILTSRLIALAGSAEAASDAGATLLREVDGIGKAKADSIAASLRQAAALVPEELDKAAAAGTTVISAEDSSYPILLKSIPDPPMVLYVRGTFQDRDLHAVGIVGSRKCSIYGREQAERFGSLLAGAGVTVLSGGARGIDSAAHRGAIAQPNGRTIAVLGSGVDVIYPPENRALFDEIAGGKGAVVSEYPMGTNPAPENFPRRNRIVSGMSRGVVVIEADERSGALITARQACDEHGRPVFAVPGRVDNPLSQGPHKLIRDGAFLCARVEDVLDNLGPLPADVHAPVAAAPVGTADPSPGLFAKPQAAEWNGPGSERARTSASTLPELPDRQQLIVDAMGLDDCGVDVIVERTDLPPHVVLQELTFLTLRGLVKRTDGQTYVRRK